MQYDFIAIPDAEIPEAVEPIFQHVVITYASEANKTVRTGGTSVPPTYQLSEAGVPAVPDCFAAPDVSTKPLTH